ncbi:TOBE domain-containing protein, partial [Staphylococcus aureus]|uniref:TOBE domain-containing protein n=1 Tax=Staphylococcus aureus TaxID=1280 RepID=UPI002108E7B1
AVEVDLLCLIQLSELLGSEIMVHSTIQGMELISKLDSRTQVMTNDKITLAFDMNNCHFFDEKTGNRIV